MNKGVILAGIGLAVGGIIYMASKAKAAPPPPPPPDKANVYGTITDAATGEHLSGVTVGLNGLIDTTDSEGQYLFENLELGDYTLEFAKDGYEYKYIDILASEGNNIVDIQLEQVIIVTHAFTFGTPSIQMYTCPYATAWGTADIQCTISNPHSVAVTHLIYLKYRTYSYTYGTWDYNETQSQPEPYRTITIPAGGSHSYAFSGVFSSPGYPSWCGLLLPKHYDYYYYLEDELGNKSPEVKIHIA